MKHTLIALILVLQCFTVNAQFEKNSVIAGGSGSYISRKQTYNKETRKTTTYSIDPLFLIQSSDDFSVGLALGYFYDYYKNEIDETGVANEWHVGPAIRYQKKFVDNFSGYGQLNFTYGKGKSEEKFINNFLTHTVKYNCFIGFNRRNHIMLNEYRFKCRCFIEPLHFELKGFG